MKPYPGLLLFMAALALVAGSCSDDDSEPVSPSCEALDTEAECVASEEVQGQRCSWVRSVAISNAATCDGDDTQKCITVSYQGEGCAAPSTCEDESQATVYVAPDGNGAMELVVGELCEYQPIEYTRCIFTEAGEVRDPSPAVCACACSQ